MHLSFVSEDPRWSTNGKTPPQLNPPPVARKKPITITLALMKIKMNLLKTACINYWHRIFQSIYQVTLSQRMPMHFLSIICALTSFIESPDESTGRVDSSELAALSSTKTSHHYVWQPDDISMP